MTLFVIKPRLAMEEAVQLGGSILPHSEKDGQVPQVRPTSTSSTSSVSTCKKEVPKQTGEHRGTRNAGTAAVDAEVRFDPLGSDAMVRSDVAD